MSSDSQSIGRIQNNVFTPIDDSFFIFNANSAVDFLYTNRESELRRLLLGDLTSQKGNIGIDIKKLGIFVLPSTDFSSFNVTLDNS